MAEEVARMNKQAIIQKLPDGICTRQQILHAARIIEPSFKEPQLRHVMETLHNFRLIVRVGRNQYKKAEKEPKKSVFTGAYSNTALQVIQCMQEQFPLLSLDVEKDGCDFVFSALTEKFPGKVLLRPKAQEILQYGTDDGIIIDHLVTEAPKSNGG